MSVLLALLVGIFIGGVLVALLTVEVLLRLAPRLELHGLRAVLSVVRSDLLRRHRSDAASLRRRIFKEVARQRVTLPSGRTYAAQAVIVWISEADLHMLTAVMPQVLLEQELGSHYAQVAHRQDWIGARGTTVVLHGRPDLPRGAMTVEARIGSEVLQPAATQGDRLDVTMPYGESSADPDLVETERFARDSCSATIVYRDRLLTLFADEPPTRLGRGSGATLRVLEEGVSRDHAVLDHQDGVWTLRPRMDARNGTFVDGVQITGPRTMRGRSIVRLGRAGSTEFSTDCRHAARD